MGLTAYTEPHCLYKGAIYLYFYYRKMCEINYNNQIGLRDMCIIRNTPKTWEYFWIIIFFPPIFMKTSLFLIIWIVGTHEQFNILFYTIDCLFLYCTSVRSKLECTVPPTFAITSHLPMPVSWNASKENLRCCLVIITPVHINTR
jgi:hypothetical protein